IGIDRAAGGIGDHGVGVGARQHAVGVLAGHVHQAAVVDRGGPALRTGEDAVGTVVLEGGGFDVYVTGVDDTGIAGRGQGQQAVGRPAREHVHQAAVVDARTGVAGGDDTAGAVAVLGVLVGLDGTAVGHAGGAARVERDGLDGGTAEVARCRNTAAVVDDHCRVNA